MKISDDMIVPDLGIDTMHRVRMRLALELSLCAGQRYTDESVGVALQRVVDSLLDDSRRGGSPVEYVDALQAVTMKAVEDEAVSMYLALTAPDDGMDDHE